MYWFTGRKTQIVVTQCMVYWAQNTKLPTCYSVLKLTMLSHGRGSVTSVGSHWLTEPCQVLSLSVTESQYSSAVSSTRPARRRLSHNQSCRIVTRHEFSDEFFNRVPFHSPIFCVTQCVCVSQTGSQCRKNAIELCLTVSDEDVSGCLDQEPSGSKW